jgi:hypothetical protein
MPRDITQPPRYAPNAVATARGWEDPKTGELLVSVKGLIDMMPKKEPVVEEKPAEKDVFVEGAPLVEKKATAKRKTTKRAPKREAKKETSEPVDEPQEPTVSVEADADTPPEETTE